MRIILSLEAAGNFSYDTKYYHKAQGFIYTLLKDTPISTLHDKKGYKFFCFSNIFPFPENLEIKNAEEKSFIISSPSGLFINFILEKLQNTKEERKPIFIGEMSFIIKKMKKMKTKLKWKNVKIITATPIIIRIPEKKYGKYGIPLGFRKKRYVYWRPQYNFEVFVKQLEENLIKKYNEFYKTNFVIERIFEMFKFIKPTVTHAIINGKEQIMVGLIWEFYFSYLSKEQKKILEFGIDCGFGERNLFGFGFMNVVR